MILPLSKCQHIMYVNIDIIDKSVLSIKFAKSEIKVC